MSTHSLKLVRWLLIVLSFAAIAASWVLEPKGGWAVLLFFLVIITGVPAAMLSLHLYPPKFKR